MLKNRRESAIPYEENSFDIFDWGYNDFEQLFQIRCSWKKNNDFKPITWKRRFPKDSGILLDAIGHMSRVLTGKKYPEKIRRIHYLDEFKQKMYILLTNTLDIIPVTIAELYHNRWQIELFFKWLKRHLKVKKILGRN